MITGSSILYFLFILIRNINRDFKLWSQDKATNHNNRFWIRLWSLIPAIALFGWELRREFSWYLLAQITISAIMVGAVWMNLFSGFYNVLRKKNWFFPGSPGPEDGVIERMIHKHPWLKYGKVVFGLASIIAYLAFWPLVNFLTPILKQIF